MNIFLDLSFQNSLVKEVRLEDNLERSDETVANCSPRFYLPKKKTNYPGPLALPIHLQHTHTRSHECHSLQEFAGGLIPAKG